MKSIRERVLAGEFLCGTWLNLGSSLIAEIAGRSGFDWVLIDLEHGAGDHQALLHQLQALESTPAVPIVRVAWNEPPRFKRVLDLGASGIMVPYVNTEEEARRAVAAMRYPPHGIRGVARFNRAAGFGTEFEEYFSTAAKRLLTITQIETAEAVQNVESIAAVDGVDVLFVGPLDLTTSLGIQMQFDHPDYLEALRKVAAAAERHGKGLGILLSEAAQAEQMYEFGFRFVALGSDGTAAADGLRTYAKTFDRFQSGS